MVGASSLLLLVLNRRCENTYVYQWWPITSHFIDFLKTEPLMLGKERRPGLLSTYLSTHITPNGWFLPLYCWRMLFFHRIWKIFCCSTIFSYLQIQISLIWSKKKERLAQDTIFPMFILGTRKRCPAWGCEMAHASFHFYGQEQCFPKRCLFLVHWLDFLYKFIFRKI